MRLGDDAEHSTFAPGTARSLVLQGPLREGEDGRGQSSGQAMEFHLLSQSNGNLLPQILAQSGRVWMLLFWKVPSGTVWGMDCRDGELTRRCHRRKPCGDAEMGQILVRLGDELSRSWRGMGYGV